MNNNLNMICTLIRAVGCTLDEALAIMLCDIKMNESGNIFIRLGMGNRERVAFVIDNAIVMHLMEDAKAQGREMLVGPAVQTYNYLSDRAYYAHRLYDIVSGNGNNISDWYHTFGKKKYDHMSLEVVARMMGIKDVQTLGALLRLKA